MHCVASRFGYPNYRLSELSLVQVSSDNRRSTVTLVPYSISHLPNDVLCCNLVTEFKTFALLGRYPAYLLLIHRRFGTTIGPIFKRHSVDWLTFEDSYLLPSANNCPSTPRNTPEYGTNHQHHGAETQNHSQNLKFDFGPSWRYRHLVSHFVVIVSDVTVTMVT